MSSSLSRCLPALAALGALWGCSLRELGYLRAGADGGDDGGSGCAEGLTAVVALAAGVDTTCALRDGGAVLCWGSNDRAKVGKPVGAVSYETRPHQVIAGEAMEVTVGGSHACARLAAPQLLVCWGMNTNGEFGAGRDYEPHPDPVATRDTDGGLFRPTGAVSAGYEHTCVAAASGEVWCFGGNFFGACGQDLGTNYVTAAMPLRGAAGVSRLSAGGLHSCAIGDGGLVCWGLAAGGVLGAAGTMACGGGACALTPVAPDVGTSGATLPFTAVAAGAGHTCAIDATRKVYCWGSSRFAQTGDTRPHVTGVPDPSAVHVVANVAEATAIAAGNATSCAVVAEGAVKCWGANESGQLGRGFADDAGHPEPGEVLGVTDAVGVAIGGRHACALTRCGQVRCWGANDAGQLGDTTTADRFEAGLVASPTP